jgi:enamine deaminase RidA (YjgF/YER057c/UK114 family)
MHHTRIRPFNTRDTYPEQNLDNDLCQAVVANGVIYLRGQIGQDLETRESVGIGDVEAQTDRAMANVALLIDEAGGSLEDVVKVVVYLVDIAYRETVYRTMGRWQNGGHVDLHQPLGPGEGGDDDSGADREHALQPAPHRAVHRLPVGDVDEVDDDLDHVFQRSAGFVDE